MGQPQTRRGREGREEGGRAPREDREKSPRPVTAPASSCPRGRRGRRQGLEPQVVTDRCQALVPRQPGEQLAPLTGACCTRPDSTGLGAVSTPGKVDLERRGHGVQERPGVGRHRGKSSGRPSSAAAARGVPGTLRTARIGLPPSVIGTGRGPSYSSFAGSMPRAAWIVAWKSGIDTGSSTIFLPGRRSTPYAPRCFSPPPASTSENAVALVPAAAAAVELRRAAELGADHDQRRVEQLPRLQVEDQPGERGVQSRESAGAGCRCPRCGRPSRCR